MYSNNVSLLTKLTYLDMTGFDTSESEAYSLHVDFEWHKLQALRMLVFNGRRLHFDENVFGLLQLPKLQEVSFIGCAVYGFKDTRVFAGLVYKFASLRPTVNIVFSDED